MHNIVAPHKSLKLYAGRDPTAAAEGNRTNSYIFSDSSLYLRINPAITATQGPNLIDIKSWDLNDLTSGALLRHYRLSRQT